ncbi:MAG: hypothetical protein IJR89_03665 [Clostridia bacterium]|nr:hypothetical protein [Clostridia bacterium]
MFHLFDKKEKPEGEDDGVIFIRKPKPNVCGGTTETLDTRAPKEISSEEMILFDATSALNVPSLGEDERLGYLSAFAAPCGEGTFLLLETEIGFRRREGKDLRWALVRESVFPALVRLVNECGLAAENGHHSSTAGLPENFGGSVHIRYASGETVSFSDNQAPVLSADTAARIADLFAGAMKGETVPLPDPADLREIRFSENREDGGYTRAALTLNADGTGTNKKASRYDGPKVYESEKPVDAETVAAIRQTVGETALLAWPGLPVSDYRPLSEKALTFTLKNGEEITVPGDRLLPDQIRDGFFRIELELATKH